MFNGSSIIIGIIPTLAIIGWYCYFRLLSNGDMSVISPLIGLYVLIPIIIATIIRKKKFTLLKILSICMSLIASVLLVMEVESSETEKDSPGIQAILFIVVFLVWSFIDTRSSILTKEVLSETGLIIFTTVGYFFTSMVIGIILRVEDYPYTYTWYWIPFWVSNFMQPSAWFVFVRISDIDVSISLPLYAINFMFPALWGIIVDHEDINSFKIVSLVLSFLSITILVISGYIQTQKEKLEITDVEKKVEENNTKIKNTVDISIV